VLGNEVAALVFVRFHVFVFIVNRVYFGQAIAQGVKENGVGAAGRRILVSLRRRRLVGNEIENNIILALK